MEKENSKWILIDWQDKVFYVMGLALTAIFIIGLVGGIIILISIKNNNVNSVIDINPSIKIDATTVKVSSFYNGKEGFSLSIPSGNTSTCIWTYAGGNASVPYIEITSANTAKEKHVLAFDYEIEGLYDFKVSCVDDLGNQYIGIFPSN